MYKVGEKVKLKSYLDLVKDLNLTDEAAMALGGQELIIHRYCAKTGEFYNNSLEFAFKKQHIQGYADYPQDQEADECRQFLRPGIVEAMLEVAKGFTAGAKKHPNETWREIPTEEHLARAMRHILKYAAGDRSENHISHIIMRALMAAAVEKK